MTNEITEQYAPQHYERITFRDADGKRRKVYAEIVRDEDGCTRAWTVNCEGVYPEPRELLIIGHGDIIRAVPMGMSLHYGTLVVL